MGLRGHACQSREEACFPVDPLELGMRGIVVPTLLLLRLGRSLRFCFLLLLGAFGQRRNHSDEALIGDRLPQMLGGMANDKQKHATFGVLSAEPVQGLVEVGVGHGRDRLASVRERVLKRGDNLWSCRWWTSPALSYRRRPVGVRQRAYRCCSWQPIRAEILRQKTAHRAPDAKCIYSPGTARECLSSSLLQVSRAKSVLNDEQVGELVRPERIELEPSCGR